MSALVDTAPANDDEAAILSSLYTEHYAEKFASALRPPSQGNMHKHTDLMLAIVTASPFPVPASLVRRVGMNASSSSTDADVRQCHLTYVEKMFATVVDESGYHWQIHHDSFDDWKWWKSATESHTQRGKDTLADISRSWETLQAPAEKAFCAKYWMRHLIEEEKVNEARELVLNPTFLMTRAVDPEGLVEECEEEMFEEDDTIVLIGEAVALGSKEDSRGRDGNLYQDCRRMGLILHCHLLGHAFPIGENKEIEHLLHQLRDMNHKFSWWCPISATMEQAGSSSRDPTTVDGHSEIVRCVVFSMDGLRVISGSADKTVRVWSTLTGKTEHVLLGHTDEIYAVAISPDGRTVASGGGNDDPTVRVWYLDDKEDKINDGENDNEFESTAVSGTVKGREGEEEKEKEEKQESKESSKKSGVVTIPEYHCAVLTGHEKWVEDVVWSSDGVHVASASGDKSIRVWNAFSSEIVHILLGHSDKVHSVSFSPDGNYVVSSSLDETLRVWNLKLVHGFHCQSPHVVITCPDYGVASVGSQYIILKAINRCRFSQCGQWLIAEAWDKTLQVWDIDSQACLASFSPGDPCMATSQYADDFVGGIVDEEINLKVVVSKGETVGIDVGTYARCHIGGQVAVAQDFERLHFLKLIHSEEKHVGTKTSQTHVPQTNVPQVHTNVSKEHEDVQQEMMCMNETTSTESDGHAFFKIPEF